MYLLSIINQNCVFAVSSTLFLFLAFGFESKNVICDEIVQQSGLLIPPSESDDEELATRILAMMVTTEEPFSIPLDERKRCRKFVLVVAKRLMKHLTNCIKQLKEAYPGKGEVMTRFQCAVKCAMVNVSLVDDDFKLNNETLSTFMSKHISEDYHDLVYRLTSKCINIHGSEANPEDPLCLGYGNFVKCAQDIVATECMTPGYSFG